MDEQEPVILRTEDLDAVRDLCIRAGLDMQEGPLEGIIAAYGAYIGGRLVGCATLQFTGGNHFLEYVAVDPQAREMGLGTLLVEKIEQEARKRGMDELWAKARSPGFYSKIGFRVLGDEERGPKNLDGCKGCNQFRKTCFPAIVVKRL